MDGLGGEACVRARMWASQRIDGELSELEGALLEAHLEGCSDCRSVADGFADVTVRLRESVEPGDSGAEAEAVAAPDPPGAVPRRKRLRRGRTCST